MEADNKKSRRRFITINIYPWHIICFSLVIASLGIYLATAPPHLCPSRIGRLILRSLVIHFPHFHIFYDFTKVIVVNRRGLNLDHETEAGTVPVSARQPESQMMESIGENFYRLFFSRDQNGDDYLDIREFKDVIKVLGPVRYLSLYKPEEPTAPENETIELHCSFIPLRLKSMTKILEPCHGSNIHYAEGLLKWTKANRDKSRFLHVDLIETFYPSTIRNLIVGDTFSIVTNENYHAAEFSLKINPDSINRYFPILYTNPSEKTIARILYLFHRRPSVYTRFSPFVSAGVLKARNASMVTIAFRLHCEFQLSSPPNYPFWFTPSFFHGHVTIDTLSKRVLDFYMSVPTERKLNVDMEWIQASIVGEPRDSTVEVDIGYIPEMSVSSSPDSSAKHSVLEGGISSETAFRLLDRHVHPFKNVTYHSFTEAFSLSSSLLLPIHMVVLWGSLDDQSC